MNKSANLCRKEWRKQRVWNKHHKDAKTIAGVDNYVVKNVKNPGWITSGGTLFLFLADSGAASYQAFLLNIGSNFWTVGIGHFPSEWMLLSLNCQKLIVTLNNSFLFKACYKNSLKKEERGLDRVRTGFDFLHHRAWHIDAEVVNSTTISVPIFDVHGFSMI